MVLEKEAEAGIQVDVPAPPKKKSGGGLHGESAPWPPGCMEWDPTHPGHEDERCCRKAYAKDPVTKEPLCPEHQRTRAAARLKAAAPVLNTHKSKFEWEVKVKDLDGLSEVKVGPLTLKLPELKGSEFEAAVINDQGGKNEEAVPQATGLQEVEGATSSEGAQNPGEVPVQGGAKRRSTDQGGEP